MLSFLILTVIWAGKSPEKKSVVVIKYQAEVDSKLSTAYEVLNKRDQTDAFLEIATDVVEYAESTFDKPTIEYAHCKVLQMIEKDQSLNIVPFVDRLDQLARTSENKELLFNYYYTMADALLDTYGDVERAGRYALIAQDLAMSSGEKYKQVKGWTIAGRALLYQDKISPAYQHYLNAKVIAESIKDPELKASTQIELKNKLYDFYFAIRAYNRAEEQKVEVINALKNQEPVDSLALMWAYHDVADLFIIMDRQAAVDKNIMNVIDYAKRNNEDKLLNYSLALARGFYIDKQNFQGLFNLYNKRFPDKLSEMQEKTPDLYCMIQGYLCEQEQKVDSAYLYFKLAGEHIAKENNLYKLSNYNLRLGQIHLRNQNYDQAIQASKKAFDLAEQVSFTDVQLESSEILEELAAGAGNYKLAYEYADKRTKLVESMNSKSEQESLTRMNLEAQEEILSVQAAQAAEETKRKFNLQYLALAVGIIILFIILIIVSSFKVSPWLIDMLGFFSVLFIFEFLILLLDSELHHMTHGAPLPIFGVKVLILSFLFPLHHLIETWLVGYLQKNKLLKTTGGFGIKSTLARLWPWRGDKQGGHHH